jgi:hypothetical protein
VKDGTGDRVRTAISPQEQSRAHKCLIDTGSRVDAKNTASRTGTYREKRRPDYGRAP